MPTKLTSTLIFLLIIFMLTAPFIQGGVDVPDERLEGQSIAGSWGERIERLHQSQVHTGQADQAANDDA